MRRRVVVFGGSFDPPTLAHEEIIRICLQLPQFQQVWVMPSCNRADKQIATSQAQRAAMLQIVWREVFACDPRLVISDVELQLGPPTQLRRTLEVLATQHADVEFWFAYGGDAYADMANWEGAEDFMPSMRALVFTEHGLPVTSDRVVRLHVPDAVQDMSSTQVRAAVARGEGVGAWVSAPVQRYITEHHLYR